MDVLDIIEERIKKLDIETLTLEELEHFTNICIAIENKRLDDLERKVNKL